MAETSISSTTWSRPARGAWIEIFVQMPLRLLVLLSRPARGAWIEIVGGVLDVLDIDGRAPHGARGLKCVDGYGLSVHAPVAPRTGRVD